MGPKLAVAVYNPEDAEIILRATKVMEKANEYRLIKPWLGDSLLLSNGKIFVYFFHLFQIILNSIKNVLLIQLAIS